MPTAISTIFGVFHTMVTSSDPIDMSADSTTLDRAGGLVNRLELFQSEALISQAS
jgi:hypothetical protein